MDAKLSYNPNFAIHPGQTLKDELEFLDLTQVELSQRTGLSEKHISQIINGADPITSDTAIKLEIALGTPATFWSNLQKNYDLTIARIAAEKRIAKEIEEAKKFTCYSELVALGCIEKATNWKTKTENLLKFFGVNSFSYIRNIKPIAFRQAPGIFNEYSLAAWLRCGDLEVQKIQTKEFDRKKIKEIVPELRKLTLLPEDFGRKLQELCSAVGIAIVYTPYFKNTRVNGATRFIGNKAVIQLNTKGTFSDIFWFTFFHELGHILLHGIKGEFIDYQKEEKEKDKKEKEADDFAAESLIPSNYYKKLLGKKPLDRIEVEIFAKSIGINRGIVLGRLAHEGKAQWKKIAHLRNRLVIKS
jgi:HTH-type transcriptional regulator/antitoxin HigA